METIKQIPSIFAFVKVGEALSFSKASTNTNVSKSHLSKMIKNLEEQMNKPLLVRTTRQVEFTEFGKQFYELCKKHVHELERISHQVEEMAQIPKGTIRITVAGAYGEEIIAPLISKLQIRYPSIKTELIFSEKILNLKKERIDLAIRVSSSKPKDGYSIKIGERKEYLCCTENFLKTHGIPKKPSDLKDYNCLKGMSDIWSFKKGRQSYKVKVDGNFKSSNGRSLTQAALAGLGIAKLPEVYIQKHFNQRELVPVLSEYTNTPVSIWGVTPFQKEVPYIVRLAIEELKSSL